MKKPQKPFGSGHFGEWFTDEYGLPAYRYACDQINDPKAVTPMNYKCREKTDHVHQVGTVLKRLRKTRGSTKTLRT